MIGPAAQISAAVSFEKLPEVFIVAIFPGSSNLCKAHLSIQASHEGIDNGPEAQTIRTLPRPRRTSPMIQARCLRLRMNFKTASALAAATMATMPIPMLNT